MREVETRNQPTRRRTQGKGRGMRGAAKRRSTAWEGRGSGERMSSATKGRGGRVPGGAAMPKRMAQEGSDGRDQPPRAGARMGGRGAAAAWTTSGGTALRTPRRCARQQPEVGSGGGGAGGRAPAAASACARLPSGKRDGGNATPAKKNRHAVLVGGARRIKPGCVGSCVFRSYQFPWN